MTSQMFWKMFGIAVCLGLAWWLGGSLMFAGTVAAAISMWLFWKKRWVWALLSVPCVLWLIQWGITAHKDQITKQTQQVVQLAKSTIPNISLPEIGIDDSKVGEGEIHPRAAEATMESRYLEQVKTALDELTYRRAGFVDWVDATLVKPAPRLQIEVEYLVDESGNRVLDQDKQPVAKGTQWALAKESWDLSRKVRANFALAKKFASQPEALVPTAQLLPDGSAWAFGYTWYSMVIIDADEATFSRGASTESVHRRPKQDQVLAVAEGWTDSVLIADDGDSVEFGYFNSADDVRRLYVRSGGAGFAELVPIEGKDHWYTRVKFVGPNLTSEPIRLKVASGGPLSVQILRVED